jgi:hypothetical protein
VHAVDARAGNLRRDRVSTPAMHVPAWLDIALEGGALELQGALAEYRALRRLCTGPWEAHAPAVAEVCARLQRREDAVDDALERARRRARVEAGASAVLPLVHEVEAERARLVQVLGGDATLLRLLMRLEERARDVSWFSAGLQRFDVERRALLVAGAASAALVPLTSWLYASEFGSDPTLLNPAAIADSPLIWLPIAVLAGLVSVFWFRLATWTWLGIRPPSVVLPLGAGLLGLGGSVAAKFPFAAGVALTLLSALVTALALLASHALRPQLAMLASLEVARGQARAVT